MLQRLHVCASKLDRVPRFTASTDSASVAGSSNITAAGQSETPTSASVVGSATAITAVSVIAGAHSDADSRHEDRDRYVFTMRVSTDSYSTPQYDGAVVAIRLC
jgi:hypothetical protein